MDWLISIAGAIVIIVGFVSVVVLFFALLAWSFLKIEEKLGEKTTEKYMNRAGWTFAVVLMIYSIAVLTFLIKGSI